METAIYVRLSQDKAGQRAGVERQEKECRELAGVKGWTVTRVYSDNDVSATTGKARPGFEALLRDAPARVVVWHTDRLLRRLRDLHPLLDLGMEVHAVQAGSLDLSTPAGQFMATNLTGIAAYEGQMKAERQRASNRQRAERGVSVWSRRPFGFDRQGREVGLVPDEARVLREVAERILAGQTVSSCARDLDARGITTSTGSGWTVTSLKRAVLNPRVGGRITYRGQEYPSNAPAILDDETFDRLHAVLTDPRRRTAPSTRTKYLLSGLAWCGRCEEQRMFATTGSGIKVLRCPRCYLTRRLDVTEDFVRGVVAERLSQPDVADLLVPDVDLVALSAEADSLRSRREGLTIALGEGLLDLTEARKQGQRLNSALSDVERRMEAATSGSPLSGVTDAPDPALAFLDASLGLQRAVVDTLVKVTVLPVGKGCRWSPDGVRVEPADDE